MRKFENWITQEVEEAFGLKQAFYLPLLTDWLTVTPWEATATEPLVADLREELAVNADFWNEDELKMQFIAPLLRLISYRPNVYKPFSQRRMRATANGIEIGGIVDYMIAQGKQIPRKPFFCLHEYKQEARRENERNVAPPRCQLLVEMIAAQALNADGNPVFGCYVTGRNWFFVVLPDHEYSVSLAYGATREPYLLDILGILEKLKTYLPRVD